MRIWVSLLVAFSIVGIEIGANAAEGKHGDQVVGCVAEHGRASLLTSNQVLAIGAGSAATFLGGTIVYFIQTAKLRDLAELEVEIKGLQVHRAEMAALNERGANWSGAPGEYGRASSSLRYLNGISPRIEQALISEILNKAKISGFESINADDLRANGATFGEIERKIAGSRRFLGRLALGSKIVGAASLGSGIVSVLASQQYGDKLDEEQEQFKKAFAPRRTENAILALYECSQQLVLNDQANNGGGR